MLSVCKDKKFTTTEEGYSCSEFRSGGVCFRGRVENPDYWKDFINTHTSSNNMTAKEACCACGGGDLNVSTLSNQNARNQQIGKEF